MNSAQVLQFVSLLFLASSAKAQLQPYTVLSNNGSVKFKIKNFGLTVDGILDELARKIMWDEAAIENGSFDVSVAAASIHTGIALHDKHLLKKDILTLNNFLFYVLNRAKFIKPVRKNV